MMVTQDLTMANFDHLLYCIGIRVTTIKYLILCHLFVFIFN